MGNCVDGIKRIVANYNGKRQKNLKYHTFQQYNVQMIDFNEEHS